MEHILAKLKKVGKYEYTKTKLNKIAHNLENLIKAWTTRTFNNSVCSKSLLSSACSIGEFIASFVYSSIRLLTISDLFVIQRYH